MKKEINLENHNYREVTGGVNGYPVPVLGLALLAESLDELNNLADQYDLEINEFCWKAGWSNCISTVVCCDPVGYSALVRDDLESQDYPSDWDLDSITETSYSDDATQYCLGVFVPVGPDGWQYADKCKTVERIPIYEWPECGLDW